ncbi:MAG TPA: hypothetical protein VHC69_24025 [Polyangiaceae bacterium]|nr:hypothetical protein [Polyangiaceae bacterium]
MSDRDSNRTAPARAMDARLLTADAVARRCVAACAGIAIVASAAVARGERPRIAVEHSRTDAATRRVLAEVRNAGLDPVDVRASDRSADVSELADRYKAVAVLSIKKPNRIELAVLSPDTREVIYASTVTSKGGTPASVRAAEELHGRLIDLPRREAPETPPADEAAAPAEKEPAPPPEPPPAKKPVPSEEPAEAAPAEAFDDVAKDSPEPGVHRQKSSAGKESPALWLGAGAGAESGAFGVAEVPVVHVEARFEPMRYFSISAFGVLPVASQNVAAPEGTAAISADVFGAMLRATALDVADVFRVTAGAGGGVALVSMSGQASSSRYDGQGASATTGVGVATIGMDARVLPWLALRADALAGLAAYRPVMLIDGRDAASWGPTFVAFTGGVEIEAFDFGGSRK